jgi:hypothetical protein
VIDRTSIVVLRMGTYPLSMSSWAKPIDLWTLHGVTHPLQDGRLARVCSSDNEDSEFDIVGNSEGILLFVHRTKRLLTVVRVPHTRGIAGPGEAGPNLYYTLVRRRRN